VRVLVTGAAGQVGRELVEAMEAEGGRGRPEVVAAPRSQLDVTDRDAVLGAVLALGPDVIVHAAAWTAVDACEEDPDRAFLANALGTRHLAEAARRTGSHVCYLSTDYVFDGTAGRPYREWDPPNPLSVYGASKLGGERELDPAATVVRTSWVCGRYGSNIVKTVLKLAGGDGPLRFIDDQHGCPTFAADLAPVLRHLALDRRPGIFHVTNQGPTTWYEFARAVVKAAGDDPARVEPVATAELSPPRPARRPPYSVLDNFALRQSGLALLGDWHDPLERLVKELSQ
jgi:dTDP-4-dehydrorhamnose reductase